MYLLTDQYRLFSNLAWIFKSEALFSHHIKNQATKLYNKLNVLNGDEIKFRKDNTPCRAHISHNIQYRMNIWDLILEEEREFIDTFQDLHSPDGFEKIWWACSLIAYHILFNRTKLCFSEISFFSLIKNEGMRKLEAY